MWKRLTVFAFVAISMVLGAAEPAFACCCIPHEICVVTGDC